MIPVLAIYVQTEEDGSWDHLGYCPEPVEITPPPRIFLAPCQCWNCHQRGRGCQESAACPKCDSYVPCCIAYGCGESPVPRNAVVPL